MTFNVFICLSAILHLYSQRGAGELRVQRYPEPPEGVFLQRQPAGGGGGGGGGWAGGGCHLGSTTQIRPTQPAAQQPAHHGHPAQTERLPLCLRVRLTLIIIIHSVVNFI